MEDKIFLVTGSTSGIGLVTALELAKTKAKVILVGRNKEKTENVINQIKKDSNNDKVEYILADLSKQKDIKKLADEFKAKYDKLDVLVNNAGLLCSKKELTEDNLENTFATNHMGYFLLTNLLLEELKKSSNARVVNVASDAHRMGDTYFDDINFEKKKYSAWKAYGNSKLYNILFTYELAEKLKNTNIKTNCLHPGVIRTNFNFGFNIPVVNSVIKMFLLSPEKGAETQIHLALSPEVENITGKYFDKKKAVSSSYISYDKEARKKLWEISENLIKLD